MKRLILFKGGIETQEFFSVELARTFEQEGYAIYWYDLVLQAESAKMLIEFYETHREDLFIAFTFNFHGMAGEAGLYKDDESFWDKSGIPVVNMVVDHPLYYQKFADRIPKKYVQISIDKNHEKYLKRFYPQIKSGGFIPLGGTELNRNYSIMKDKKYLSISERPLDVIFTGNYTPNYILRKDIKKLDKDYQEFYESIFDDVKANPDQLIEDVGERHVIAEMGRLTDEQLKDCMPNMLYADLAVRFYYRGLAVAALADNGIKVHTFGAGWNMLECKHPENIIQAGSVDSLRCLEEISQAKISLNVMPWFKAGAHDRIFNTMLNGAVCLSDESSYINEIFEDENNISIYRLENLRANPESVAEQVKRLLSNEDKLQKIADSGYMSCANTHSWQQRAYKIIEIFNQFNSK